MRQTSVTSRAFLPCAHRMQVINFVILFLHLYLQKTNFPFISIHMCFFF